ncbi:MAG: cytochrome P450, partial [Verrucomicrobiota bacterium]
AMRLYPPAWIVAREAAVDCVIGGYALPKGTAIMMSQWIKHRDGRVFERPNDFDPTRWLQQAPLPKFAYFPFGGGPRLCIGSGFAMMEAPLGLARICQSFRFECDADYDVKPWATITLHPTGGMHLRVRAVED